MKKLVIFTHFTMKIYVRTSILPVIRKFYFLENTLAYCGTTSPFFLLLSEHKHCHNTATNSNSKNARSRTVSSLQAWVRTKEDKSSTGRVWVARFYHVTARSRLAHVLELRNRLFL